MSTIIRPKLSERNPYWIEKHRYCELKHFCLQYPIWKREYLYLDSIKQRPINIPITFGNGIFSDPTADCAEIMMFYTERICMIEKAASDTQPELAHYILKGVTEGVSYEYLKFKLEIPCCKDKYYELYRKFFWLLSKARQ